jgi:hypothetical protein
MYHVPTSCKEGKKKQKQNGNMYQWDLKQTMAKGLEFTSISTPMFLFLFLPFLVTSKMYN